MKKCVACALAVIAFTISCTTTVSATSGKENTNDMDMLDVVIAASIFLNSSSPENDIWIDTSVVEAICPLYNPSGSIVAYYIKINPFGYAVINNNLNNPAAIEFGRSDNDLIRDIISSCDSPHIIYNSPSEIYNTNGSGPSVISMGGNDITTYFPNLNEADYSLAGIHSELRALAENGVQALDLSTGDLNYGFLASIDLPSGYFWWDIIDNAKNVDWAIYDDYNDIAHFHCGAVAVTNIALYYATRGYTSLKVDNSKDKTFEAVHKFVDNGPMPTIAGYAVEYFASRGYTLNHCEVSNVTSTFSGLQSAIQNNRPCAILLADAVFNWHWVVCVGWRSYGGNLNYMQIVNGWENTVDRFYMGNNGSLWISTTEYWIG